MGLARGGIVFTIAIYFWCFVAALTFGATLLLLVADDTRLVADYVFRNLPSMRKAALDETDEAPRSTIIPVSVAR
jgi:hypothetical protein